MRRLASVSVLVCALFLLMGADNETSRYNSAGSKIMCTCGCAQMLLKCNHVGCPNSAQMIRELQANVERNASEDDILKWFREHWGVTAVVEPSTHGFELLAWIMPPAALALGLSVAFLLIRNWRMRPSHAVAATVPLDPALESFRNRARKETES
jgi:cytochrome c-type biogenesis protein CcmH/NrfF